ncbi:hypothetical protein HNR77_002544 [Paenibacillus sp. JGP012]|nr:hypothetical protein [Paenibacillus sp. JGP012]
MNKFLRLGLIFTFSFLLYIGFSQSITHVLY